MIANLWNRISFYCTNHDKPIKMYYYRHNEEPFYACVKYMRKDEAHPDGYEPGERACPNRLSYYDAMGIVEKISELIESESENFGAADLTNTRFKYKHTDVCILKYTPDKIRVGIYNNAAFL